MRSIFLSAVVGIIFSLSGSFERAWAIVAFPGAEGFGANAIGGRGGSVYHVTNLNDSGADSLRNGITSATGPRTIVFDVGGTIQLQSALSNYKSYITIAGQTAPGAGIEVVGNTTSTYANDVIIRYMRFRGGDAAQDSLSVRSSKNVIIDHVSASWGMDETLSVTLSNNVTVQNSIIAETLNPNGHSAGSLVRGNVTASTLGGYTFSHNLWISNDYRNPAIGSRQTYDQPSDVNAQLQLDLVNNVIYNWGSRTVHTVQSSDNMYTNMVNNMFIAGPSTQSPDEVMRLEIDQAPLFGYDGELYVYESGNLIDSDKDATYDPGPTTRSMFKDGPFSSITFDTTPYAFPAVTTQSAEDAYQQVLATVGASLQRDTVDARLISEVMGQGGSIIDSQNEVGGYPILPYSVRPSGWDTDGDGMPNSWELLNGLNPNDAVDRNGIAANDYTNLENYLNSVVVPEPSVIAVLVTAGVAMLLRMVCSPKSDPCVMRFRQPVDRVLPTSKLGLLLSGVAKCLRAEAFRNRSTMPPNPPATVRKAVP